MSIVEELAVIQRQNQQPMGAVPCEPSAHLWPRLCRYMNNRRPKKCVLCMCLVGAVLFGVTCVRGQESAPGPAAPPEDTATELQARWEYYVPVPIPAAAMPIPDAPPNAGGPALVDFILGPSVFPHARLDLGDLRLYDVAGQPVPYALRYLRPKSERDRVPTEEFNRSEPKDGPTELTLDLNGDDIEHNEIEIVTSGENFRRAVEAEGSDDGKLWRRLARGYLIRFAHDDQKINLQSISYPTSRFRYVRVRVSPDPARLDSDGGKDEFTTEVHVLRHVDVPGETLMLTGTLGPREPVRTYGAPGSAWIIELGGQRVPCDRIEVDVADAEFARDIQIEYELLDEIRSRVVFSSVTLTGESLWQRRAGEPKKPMVVLFSEVQTSRLKLRVTDYRNPPLTIRTVKFGVPARQVVFARPPSDKGELRLYFGNPGAEPPNYDFARNLPAKLPSPPVRVPLGEAQRNPDFVPPPQPFTEQFPWLIYVVLSSVTVVLSTVIVSLSRTAIAIHDATNVEPPAPNST